MLTILMLVEPVIDGVETAGNTDDYSFSSFFLIRMLVAVSNGMWALKLCSSEILQFLTQSAG